MVGGLHGRRRAGPGESFWQFRPFVTGEAAARIDWRRSARDDRLYVRTIAGLKRADALWRRIDADFLDPLELNTASRLGVPGVLAVVLLTFFFMVYGQRLQRHALALHLDLEVKQRLPAEVRLTAFQLGQQLRVR